jgi:transposase InsO family protein
MTEALFSEVSIKENELIEDGKRRLNVSGVLRELGVSRSGYNTWKNRIPSNRQQYKKTIHDRIQEIYDESHQNYGAPKITKILNAEDISIVEKTVGNYMREMGIRAQYIKPYTVTTINSDFSTNLTNVLNEEFNPPEPNAVWCSDYSDKIVIPMFLSVA